MEQNFFYLRKITKEYLHLASSLKVLDNITIAFTQGTSYAITGHSGSGKSTLLALLAGLEKPTNGVVLFNTYDINSFSAAQKAHFLNFNVGLVFQNPHLIAELTIEENVMLPGIIAGIPKETIKARTKELLSQVGIAEKADNRPFQLSGGQQQRAALARALFNKPSFLLADEPTGNLDQETGLEIINLLLHYQKEWRMGLIISTHDEKLASNLDTIYSIKNGQIISSAPPPIGLTN